MKFLFATALLLLAVFGSTLKANRLIPKENVGHTLKDNRRIQKNVKKKQQEAKSPRSTASKSTADSSSKTMNIKAKKNEENIWSPNAKPINLFDPNIHKPQKKIQGQNVEEGIDHETYSNILEKMLDRAQSPIKLPSDISYGEMNTESSTFVQERKQILETTKLNGQEFSNILIDEKGNVNWNMEKWLENNCITDSNNDDEKEDGHSFENDAGIPGIDEKGKSGRQLPNNIVKAINLSGNSEESNDVTDEDYRNDLKQRLLANFTKNINVERDFDETIFLDGVNDGKETSPEKQNKDLSGLEQHHSDIKKTIAKYISDQKQKEMDTPKKKIKTPKKQSTKKKTPKKKTPKKTTPKKKTPKKKSPMKKATPMKKKTPKKKSPMKKTPKKKTPMKKATPMKKTPKKKTPMKKATPMKKTQQKKR